MTSLMVKLIADFQTTLALKVAVGATTGTLTSGLDADGVQLPTGTYGFTVDRNNSNKEYFTATLTGSALTAIKTVTRGTGVGTSGLARAHRKGAEVIISDWVALRRMMDVFDGTTGFDSATPLTYDGAPTFTDGNSLVTKDYADAIAVAGGADASTTTKGITKMSVAPASAAEPIAVGDNDNRVSPVSLATVTSGQVAALPGNNTDIAVGSGNKFVTQTGLQDSSEIYAADGGANDTYVVTLSPIPTGYTTGMVVRFKANTANTGACTLNVNSLGAKTIKKEYNADLENSDIVANQIVSVIYDGTNFQLLSGYYRNKGCVASDTLRESMDTENYQNSSDYVVGSPNSKSFRINKTGVIRIKIDMKAPFANDTAYAKIYLNGVATTNEVTISGASSNVYATSTFSDINVCAGDVILIKGKGTDSYSSAYFFYHKNCRVYYDEALLDDVDVITD